MQRIATRMLGFIVLAFTLSVTVQAQVPAAVEKTIRSKLEQARPDFAYGKVESSPVPGFYQVKVQYGPLLYVSGDGNYVFSGNLYGLDSGKFVDLKELALKPKRQQMLGQLAASDLVVFPAKGQRKAYISVFTDVDCGYCQKLHREVPALNELGIEVRYLAYPRAGIGSRSHQKIAAAWCSEDRQDAMNRLKSRQSVDAPDCETPVAEHFQLGQELGVSGTPAIFLADGTLLPGYMPAEELASRLGL